MKFEVALDFLFYFGFFIFVSGIFVFCFLFFWLMSLPPSTFFKNRCYVPARQTDESFKFNSYKTFCLKSLFTRNTMGGNNGSRIRTEKYAFAPPPSSIKHVIFCTGIALTVIYSLLARVTFQWGSVLNVCWL